MNERIQQLWRQVELQECDCGCNPDEFLRSKFAKLIVEECAQNFDKTYMTGGETVGNYIRRKFGVEEDL
jgi:hypothetical protein